MESLIAHLFFARELAHRAHFATGSYAQHMALGAFYDAIVDNADAIAEAYMGRTGTKLTNIPFVLEQPSGDIVADLEAQRAWIDENRAEVSSDSEIQNLIDGAIETFDTAIYKLRFLA